MAKSQKANTELDDFFNFQKHLCEELSRLKNYSSSTDFLMEQNKKVVNDFFFDNLFMLYQSTFNLDVNPQSREDIEYMWNNLILYHYTDSPSLEQIISGQSLKLNCILKMNDSGEGQALIINILQQFTDMFRKNKSINIDDVFTGLSFANKVSALQKIMYSFSFTTLKDDASQWARYGMPKEYATREDREPTEIEKNPCGICIEVPMKNLLKLVKTINNDFELAEITPILYIPNNNTNNTFLKFIKSIIDLRLKKEKSSEFSKYVSHYSSDIKHESFKKEYETRLLISLKNKNNMAYPPHYVDRISNEEGQYIILNLAKKLQHFSFTDLFSSITLGPETSSEAAKCVKELLEKNNLSSLTPKNSKCTLRSTPHKDKNR